MDPPLPLPGGDGYAGYLDYRNDKFDVLIFYICDNNNGRLAF